MHIHLTNTTTEYNPQIFKREPGVVERLTILGLKKDPGVSGAPWPDSLAYLESFRPVRDPVWGKINKYEDEGCLKLTL